MSTHETTLQHIKPASIATHARNPRQNVGDVADLAASIVEHGVLEPLVIAPWPATLKASAAQMKKHLLIAGHRRLAAATLAKSDTVPCILRNDLDTEAKQLEAMLVENLHRADLTPVEEGDAYQTLLEFPGFTQTKLAKDVGQPVSRIRERLKIAKLDTAVKSKLHNGQITISDALAIDEFADDAKTTRSLMGSAGTDNFKYALQTARRERDQQIELDKRLKAFQDADMATYKSKGYDDYPKGFKSLNDLMGYESQAGGDKRALKHAKDCDGAVVVITAYRGIEHGCTKAKNHPKPKVTKTKAQLAVEAKDKADAKAIKDGSDVAADLRILHLRDVIASAPTVPLIRGRLVDITLDHPGYEDPRGRKRRLRYLARLLQVDLDPSDGNALDELDWELQANDQLRTALGKLDVPALVVVADVSANFAAEEGLADTSVSLSYYSGRTQAWAKVLESDYGYSWSPWERQRYTQLLNPASTDEEGDE